MKNGHLERVEEKDKGLEKEELTEGNKDFT